jgi:hypothetical protein
VLVSAVHAPKTAAKANLILLVMPKARGLGPLSSLLTV